jgi:hypothetical protein
MLTRRKTNSNLGDIAQHCYSELEEPEQGSEMGGARPRAMAGAPSISGLGLGLAISVSIARIATTHCHRPVIAVTHRRAHRHLTTTLNHRRRQQQWLNVAVQSCLALAAGVARSSAIAPYPAANALRRRRLALATVPKTRTRIFLAASSSIWRPKSPKSKLSSPTMATWTTSMPLTFSRACPRITACTLIRPRLHLYPMCQSPKTIVRAYLLSVILRQ